MENKELYSLIIKNDPIVYDYVTKNLLKLLAYDIRIDALLGVLINSVSRNIVDNDVWFSSPVKLLVSNMTWYKNRKVQKPGIISFSLPVRLHSNTSIKIRKKLYDELKNKIDSVSIGTLSIGVFRTGSHYKISKRYNIFKQKLWKTLLEDVIFAIRCTGYDVDIKYY